MEIYGKLSWKMAQNAMPMMKTVWQISTAGSTEILGQPIWTRWVLKCFKMLQLHMCFTPWVVWLICCYAMYFVYFCIADDCHLFPEKILHRRMLPSRHGALASDQLAIKEPFQRQTPNPIRGPFQLQTKIQVPSTRLSGTKLRRYIAQLVKLFLELH